VPRGLPDSVILHGSRLSRLAPQDNGLEICPNEANAIFARTKPIAPRCALVPAAGTRYIAAHDDDRHQPAATPCPRGTGVRSLIVLVPPDSSSAADQFLIFRGAGPAVVCDRGKD
jgi:hypothetical protein